MLNLLIRLRLVTFASDHVGPTIATKGHPGLPLLVAMPVGVGSGLALTIWWNRRVEIRRTDTVAHGGKEQG